MNQLKKLIGNTKTIKIIYKYKNTIRNAFFKAEWYNLSGSIKDRVAYKMLVDAYESGALKKGQPICEVTSGNMGISLACLSRIFGNPMIACIPKSMSKERIDLLQMYGATVELYDTFEECFKRSEELGKKGVFLPKQFASKSNMLAHFETTGPEIFKQVPQAEAFIAGVGTAGTLTGVGNYLKTKKDVLIYALEPSESKILATKEVHGHHGIQGLSDNIIPALFDYSLITGIVEVSTHDSIAMAQKLCTTFGLGVGISSGANFLGAVLLEKDNVVSVFADDNKKYLSTKLSNPISTPLVDSIELIDFEVIE